MRYSCRNCNGSGLVIGPLICPKCCGIGSLNWLESLFGKENPEEFFEEEIQNKTNKICRVFYPDDKIPDNDISALIEILNDELFRDLQFKISFAKRENDTRLLFKLVTKSDETPVGWDFQRLK